MADFTPTQGRYLSFIHTYTKRYGCPPAESEIAAAMCVAPPSVNQMVKTLEKKGLILRQPGVPRSIRLLVSEDEIPSLRGDGGRGKQPAGKQPAGKRAKRRRVVPAAPPEHLYVLEVYVTNGPLSEKFANKEISRRFEIRGDQTLHQLHEAIFQAYDRIEEQPYEFQLGRRPFDPKGPNYGIPAGKKGAGRVDARETTLNDLELKLHRTFGYWFESGEGWFHQVQVERIDEAIPTVTYPRVIRRVGKSPPQYPDAK